MGNNNSLLTHHKGRKIERLSDNNPNNNILKTKRYKRTKIKRSEDDLTLMRKLS